MSNTQLGSQQAARMYFLFTGGLTEEERVERLSTLLELVWNSGCEAARKHQEEQNGTRQAHDAPPPVPTAEGRKVELYRLVQKAGQFSPDYYGRETAAEALIEAARWVRVEKKDDGDWVHISDGKGHHAAFNTSTLPLIAGAMLWNWAVVIHEALCAIERGST